MVAVGRTVGRIVELLATVESPRAAGRPRKAGFLAMVAVRPSILAVNLVVDAMLSVMDELRQAEVVIFEAISEAGHLVPSPTRETTI